jgi:hypothetical protein
MDSSAFVAGMNALGDELEVMPELSKMVCGLLELVDQQQASIGTLLAANRKLLNVIDELKD